MIGVSGQHRVHRLDRVLSRAGFVCSAIIIGFNSLLWIHWLAGDWNYVPNERRGVLATTVLCIGIPILTAASVYLLCSIKARDTRANRALGALLVANIVTIPFLLAGMFVNMV